MIKVPTNFIPRDYQLKIWNSFVVKQDKKRGMLIWPRRAGKDLTCLNILAYHACVGRKGNYYYFSPTYAQGKKIIWDGKDRTGQPFLKVFPGFPKTRSEDPCSLIDRIDQREMKIHLVNGSMFQVIGCEDEDSIVGTNPVGCVFTEYSIMNPRAWDLVRPILRENGGWCLFTYTARGLNHGYRLYERNKDNPRWHVEFHTCETLQHDGKRVVTPEMIAEEIEDGMDEDLIRQEYYNDFYASNQGAYYSRQMRTALDQGRIGSVPWQPHLQVYTSWDIGHRDATAIWFFQLDGYGNVNIIDAYSNTGQDVTHYIGVLKDGHRAHYKYGGHFGPHDMQNKNFQTGKSTQEVALGLGVRFTVVPKLGIQEGIDALRLLLPRCRFDEQRCGEGLEALRQYRKEESGLTDMHGKPIFREKPLHDWTSHYADSARYLAVAVDKVVCHNTVTDINGDVVHLPDQGVQTYDLLSF